MISPRYVVLLQMPFRSTTQYNITIGVHGQIPPNKCSMSNTIFFGFTMNSIFTVCYNTIFITPIEPMKIFLIGIMCNQNNKFIIYHLNITCAGIKVLKESVGNSLSCKSNTLSIPWQFFMFSGILINNSLL